MNIKSNRKSPTHREGYVESSLGSKGKNRSLHTLTGCALLLALLLMLNFSGLGFLPITPTGVTILQVPVIIATLALGLPSGLFMGLAFGLMSMYSAYTTPALLNAPFMHPLVAVFPRLLIPLAVYLLSRLLSYPSRPKWWKAICLGAAGSLTNTIFVLGMMALLYGEITMQALGVSAEGLAGALVVYGAVSGLPEAAVSAILCAAIVGALSRLGKKR